jgi:hypothetical protein
MTATVGSSAWRAEFWGPGCDPAVIVAKNWVITSGKIQCHKNAIRAFRALGRIMVRRGYVIRRDVTGCYNCRPITGGTAPSAHSQAIALDVNWDTNPYRLDKVVTDVPRALVEEVQSLTTDQGVKAFRWGGDWDGRPDTRQSNYDAMHWEIICTPEEMRAGFSIPAINEEDRTTWPLLDLDEKGEAVRHLQWYLALERTDIAQDGYFGPKTAAAVRDYQTSRGLPADGVVGYGTWTSFISRQPLLAQGAATPTKNQHAPV